MVAIHKPKRVVCLPGFYNHPGPGELRLLRCARQQFPDAHVIVALNSDRSCLLHRQERGSFNPEDYRRACLTETGFADDIVSFDELTPVDLLKNMKPDYHVKGPNWIGKELPGGDIVAPTFVSEPTATFDAMPIITAPGQISWLGRQIQLSDHDRDLLCLLMKQMPVLENGRLLYRMRIKDALEALHGEWSAKSGAIYKRVTRFGERLDEQGVPAWPAVKQGYMTIEIRYAQR